MRFAVATLAIAALAACTSREDPPTVAFDLDGPLADETFWDLPFPSDLRLAADGTPDLSGFPGPHGLPIIHDLLSVAAVRRGFPVMPVAYFRFTGTTPPPHDLSTLATDALLVDIDPASPERGTRFAVVALSLTDDDYTGHGLVAIAPRPGVVLRGDTRYAVLLTRAFAPDASPPAAFTDLASQTTPPGARGAAAAALYAPLWPTLEQLHLSPDDLLVATVFTTGDEVATLRARSEAVRATQHARISNLHVAGAHATFCDLAATVTLPQYQLGTPPFDTQGNFALDASGAPIAQRTMDIPLHITLPARAMPAAGWPLWQYFHGSGGASTDIVDDGPALTSADNPTPGEGPGYVVARRGIAAASAAMPVNPERQPGASNYAYLNFNNLASFPYTFQQGVFEQRLLLDALLELQITPDVVAACPGVSLPPSATAHHFDPAALVAGGHSMGGMYTNMIAAVEPRYGAITPFGAGGFWNLMILDTGIVPGARDLLGGAIGVDPANMTFVHPALGLLEMGWEIAEPGASMAKIARRPLPGFAARHVYEPIGLDDVFFPTPVFDAAALAYGNQQAGELVWPGTQDALAVDHLDGMLAYPVARDRTTTAVVVQYHDDGLVDAHYIHRQLPAVRYQYACFLASYLATGTPSVPAPVTDDSIACP